MLGKEIPELMKLIQKEEAQAVAKQKTEAPIKGVWNINMVITLTFCMKIDYSLKIKRHQPRFIACLHHLSISFFRLVLIYIILTIESQCLNN